MDGATLAILLLAGLAGEDIGARGYWNCGSMMIPMGLRGDGRDEAARGQRAGTRQPLAQPRRPELRRRSAPCFRLAGA